MRIGIISGEYPPLPGGVGDYSAQMVAAWSAGGHHVHILARPESQEPLPTVTMHNVVPGWGLPVLALIRHWIQHNHLDVVNLQYQTAIYDMSGWMHFVPRVSPVPVVTTFHDLLVPYLFPKAGRVREWIVRTLASSSAAAVTTNNDDYARLAALSNRHLIPIGSNIHVAPMTDAEKSALRATVAQPDDILLIHFGFLYPNRGVEDLLKALRNVLDAGTKARLVIVGGREGGPTSAEYVTELDTLITTLGLTAYVTWTGYLESEQVSRWLQTADWVVLPFRDGASHRRGSLIAAVMHGCAIITTAPTVPMPGFDDGQQLLYFPVGDVAALTQTLLTVSGDSFLRNRLQQQISHTRSQFEWSGIASQFITLFEALTHD